MLTTRFVTALALASVSAATLAARDPDAPARNRDTTGATQHRLANVGPRGPGLAPTTWGFVSKYSGTLYGSGYYAFRVDQTYAGANSIYGYTYNLPTDGFVNQIRAIYLFDISSLIGQASPVWSAFMFQTREQPAAGEEGLSAYAQVNLAQAGAVYTLSGSTLTDPGLNVDVYDAEDFENAAPFDTPEAAFTGMPALIGSFAAGPTPVVFSLDVTSAVNLDIPAGATGTLTTPASVSFPAAVVGGVASTRSVDAVADAGNTVVISIDSCAIAGTHAADFSQTPLATPAPVAAGVTVGLPVRFRPQAPGARTATLTCALTNAATASFTTALNGTGTPALPAPLLGPLGLGIFGVLVLGSGALVLRQRAR